MKKIKHSKFKNTGVLFELLIRQITLEVLNGDTQEKAKKILKWEPKGDLPTWVKEYKKTLK